MIATDMVELEFKGSRKEVFSNSNDLKLDIGDFVIVKLERGTDLAQVCKVGRLVQLKDSEDNIGKILRLASDDEIKKIDEIRLRENQASVVCKQKIAAVDLKMKLVDVEMQFDGNKIIFYFTSDRRVDFRKLIKELSVEFKTRIELRQIGVRDEARRVGGCGNCGRDLCCSSFIKKFEPISTQYARDQNLPLSPGKLSGACGRLMCCLAYEREYYEETLKKYPTLDTHYKWQNYKGTVIKLDIFNEELTIRSNQDEYIQMNLDEFNKLLTKKELQMIPFSELEQNEKYSNQSNIK